VEKKKSNKQLKTKIMPKKKKPKNHSSPQSLHARTRARTSSQGLQLVKQKKEKKMMLSRSSERVFVFSSTLSDLFSSTLCLLLTLCLSPYLFLSLLPFSLLFFELA